MAKSKVAVLRPDDSRIREAVRYLRSRGVTPIEDPMLTVSPTGQTPGQAAYCIFTSKTGVEIAAKQGWKPGEATVCAVGQTTATALREWNYSVDVVPSTATSRGLAETLADEVAGQSVEIARSAHGSEVLINELAEAGATVHETQLYRLERPPTAGRSVTLATQGVLDGTLFTSPKTVEHFIEIARERDSLVEARRGLSQMIVGVIGTPTEQAVRRHDVSVDVKPETVGFEQLADRVVDEISGSTS